MAEVYMLSTQPAWDSFATPVAFFSTTLLLGTLAIGAAFVANYAYVRRKNPDCEEVQCDLLRSSLRWIALVSIVLLGVNFVVAPLYLAYLGSTAGPAAASAALYFFEYPWVFVLRLVLAFLGAGILAVFLYQNALSPGKETIAGTLAYSAFALVLVSEILGRFLFYATQVQIGL
jgi:anaerobic dimethyl sulfoxide reductase subunit C (anchor subunit)